MKDPEKVIERLSEYISAADDVHRQVQQYKTDTVRRRSNAGIFGSGPNDETAFQALPDDVRSQVLELEPSALRILVAIDEELAARFRTTKNLRRRTDLVRRAIAAVRTLGEVDEWLGPVAPAPDPSGLHRVVAGPATVYWDAGQYRVAVDEAARAVNAHLQTALGRRGLDNTDLVRQAFSAKQPSDDQPRLRFPDLDKATDERTWTSRHQGAMEFGAGLFQAVRNLTAHADPNEELTPEYALDCLSSFSLLARWVDEAERREDGD